MVILGLKFKIVEVSGNIHLSHETVCWTRPRNGTLTASHKTQRWIRPPMNADSSPHAEGSSNFPTNLEGRLSNHLMPLQTKIQQTRRSVRS
mmetsp:Transcript_28310/g.34547  ORF Transcript_28310/g.34547 Transcript_28310/m.34547 type:complete len:91 (+) Transcript_28310:985-1257(+)